MEKENKKLKNNVAKKSVGQPTLKSLIKDEVEVYNKYFDVPFIPFGQKEPVYIRIYPLFSPQRVNKIVQECMEFFKKANDEKIEIPPEEEVDIIGYFIIKNATNVKTTTSKKAKTIYDEFKMLVNSKFYTEIITFFPEESINSVHERILEVLDMSSHLYKQIQQIQKEVKKIVESN